MKAFNQTARWALTAYWTGASVVLLIAVALAVFMSWRDYNNSFETAAKNNLNLAGALAEQTTLTFVKLEALAKAVIEDRSDPIVPPDLFSEVLNRRAAAEPAAKAIVLVDASGRVFATSNPAHPVGEDLSQTATYRALSIQLGLPRHLSPSYRISSGIAESQWTWAMDFAQRINDLDGNFAGYVLIEIDKASLYNFYVNLPQEDGRVIGLVGEDGIIRISNNQSVIGSNIKPLLHDVSGGDIRIANSPLTGIRQIFAYSKPTAAPLLAYVGTPVEAVYEAWRGPALIVASALTALGGALVALGVMLGKYIRNQKFLIHNRIEMEREQQERVFLEAILNTGGALVAVTDAAGKPIVVNPALQELFGRVETGESGQFRLATALNRGVDEIIEHLPLETGVRTMDQHGRMRELSWTVTAIRDSAGSVRNLVAIGFDNTERREAELAIYQSGKLITLGEMATGLAHEINQPLGAIVLTLDHIQARLLQKNADAAFLRKHLDAMTAQAERASRVIDHMRIYGRRSDGSTYPLDPVEGIEGALTIAGRQIENAGIALRKNYQAGTIWITAEITALEQILINLLLNARDAILEKHPHRKDIQDWIAIDLSKTDDGFACLGVRDSGGGIPTDAIHRVFEPFFTTKPVGKGTGLGLALSYGMARSLGGRLEVRNGAEGAEFLLFFPKAEKPEEERTTEMTAERRH
jgi:PAS domain S-box-containing protein